MAKQSFLNIYSARNRGAVETGKKYPESQVVLDPTCTLQMILNRAEYGVPIPQKDVSGSFTQEELNVLGIDATSLHLYNRMQLIDLRMRAQTRMQALATAKRKREAEATKRAYMAELRHQFEQEKQKEKSE